MKLDKRPKYQFIVDDMKAKIKSGEISADEPIPSQIELAKHYQTSEITSRRALTELANEGLIYRVKGKGSFVNKDFAEAVTQENSRIRTIYLVHQNVPLHLFSYGFFGDMLRGLYEQCEAYRVAFRLWNIAEKGALPPNEEHNGLVLLPAFQDTEYITAEAIAGWKRENRKFVTTHYYFPHLQIPYVIVDNMTGGYLATQHLLSIGHRRIGIVLTGNSPVDINQEFSLRLQGYKLALQQYQIEFDPSLVVIMAGDSEDAESGAQGFDRLMDLAQPPTAVFMTSDIKAIGAMHAAERRGLDIPGDISFVGYDDLNIGNYLHPGLTTINQNTYLMGRKAAEFLWEWDNGSAGFRKEEIVPSLIVRDSTAEWLTDEPETAAKAKVAETLKA